MNNLNHFVCPTCRRDFFSDCSYATCQACQTFFYFNQSAAPSSAAPDAVAEKLENLASDLEECGRLAHIEAAEQRTYKSLGAQARRILAALNAAPRE